MSYDEGAINEQGKIQRNKEDHEEESYKFFLARRFFLFALQYTTLVYYLSEIFKACLESF